MHLEALPSQAHVLCRRTIQEDAFVKDYVDDLLAKIRTQVRT
jgi:hypothetical protein